MSSPQKPSSKGKSYRNPYETQAQSGRGVNIAKDIETQRIAMEKQMAEAQAQSEFDHSSFANPEFSNTVFELNNHRESVDRPQKIKEIQQLVSEIRNQVKEIKTRSQGLNAEVEQIEKATLQSLPDKPGVYHVRYLEILLSFLQGIKAKVGEAKTWLMAMQSKKEKRGSAFAAQSKKKGTQYSLSQELSNARNVM